MMNDNSGFGGLPADVDPETGELYTDIQEAYEAMAKETQIEVTYGPQSRFLTLRSDNDISTFQLILNAGQAGCDGAVIYLTFDGGIQIKKFYCPNIESDVAEAFRKAIEDLTADWHEDSVPARRKLLESVRACVAEYYGG